MNSLKLILFRMRKSVAYWIAFALFGALGIVFAILATTIFKGTIGIANLLILPFSMQIFSSESIRSVTFVPPYPFFLFSIGFAIVFVGEEFRTGTIKSQALSGKSRTKIFLSMALAGFVLAISLVLVFQLLATLLALLLKVPFCPEMGFPLGNNASYSDSLPASQEKWIFLQSLAMTFLVYLVCYLICFSACANFHNGWIGVIFGAVVFLILFVVGMVFFSLGGKSIEAHERKFPFLLEVWLPHFWIRSFSSFSQSCVYEITKDGEWVTHADRNGYLSMVAGVEIVLASAITLFAGIFKFRKVDLR